MSQKYVFAVPLALLLLAMFAVAPGGYEPAAAQDVGACLKATEKTKHPSATNQDFCSKIRTCFVMPPEEKRRTFEQNMRWQGTAEFWRRCILWDIDRDGRDDADDVFLMTTLAKLASFDRTTWRQVADLKGWCGKGASVQYASSFDERLAKAACGNESAWNEFQKWARKNLPKLADVIVKLCAGFIPNPWVKGGCILVDIVRTLR